MEFVYFFGDSIITFVIDNHFHQIIIPAKDLLDSIHIHLDLMVEGSIPANRFVQIELERLAIGLPLNLLEESNPYHIQVLKLLIRGNGIDQLLVDILEIYD